MRAVLVALALLGPVAGCLSGSPGAEAPDEFGTARTDDALVEDLTYAFPGTVSGVPVAPGIVEHPFDVPKGATEISAVLEYENAPATSFRLHLVGPDGEVKERGFPERAGRLSVATVDPPASGTWTARVVADRAVSTDFALDVRVAFLVPLENVLSDTVTVAATDFVELNLIMEEGGTFRWRYEASGGTVEWDIHSHEDGRTQIHERGAGDRHEGAFTAPKRQIYSILFESLTPSPITLAYEVTGAFRVHSHSQ